MSKRLWLLSVLLLVALLGSGVWWKIQDRKAWRSRIRKLENEWNVAFVSTSPQWLTEFIGAEQANRFFSLIPFAVLTRPEPPGTFVDNSMMEFLSHFPRLQEIVIVCRTNDAAITAEGFAYLTALPELIKLACVTHRVDDAALFEIGKLHQLEYLELRSSSITDSGLEHLKNLKNLNKLDLRDSTITPKGIAGLQKALPNCEILGP